MYVCVCVCVYVWVYVCVCTCLRRLPLTWRPAGPARCGAGPAAQGGRHLLARRWARARARPAELAWVNCKPRGPVPAHCRTRGPRSATVERPGGAARPRKRPGKRRPAHPSRDRRSEYQSIGPAQAGDGPSGPARERRGRASRSRCLSATATVWRRRRADSKPRGANADRNGKGGGRWAGMGSAPSAGRRRAVARGWSGVGGGERGDGVGLGWWGA